MGIAVIIPDISFGDANLGKVTLSGDVPIQAIAIIANSSYIGTSATLSVRYTPATTTHRGVVWSIESGGEYATINPSSGKLTILSTANNSNVSVKATSIDDSSISATKTISVSYSGGLKTLYTYEDCTKDNVALRSDGEETSDANYLSSDFIEIGNAKSIEYCFCFPNIPGYCGFNVYDSSKIKVGGSDRSVANYEAPATYQVKDGDKYFRFTVGMDKANARWEEAKEKCYVKMI